MVGKRLIPVLLLLLSLVSCTREAFDFTLSAGPFGSDPDRKVMLLYEAGFNSLSFDLAANIGTLKNGYLPGNAWDDDVLLVFSHLYGSTGTKTQDTAPALFRMYSSHGTPVLDTLRVWPSGTSAANASMVREVFSWVRETFPASGYGAVLSSHATGWLPEWYFNNPKKYEGGGRTPSVWATSPFRTFGQEYYSSGTKSEEIELKDLAAAIPYKLDYILFDACLMGTVEVVWELRNTCSYLAVSPCEIPAAGFDYSTLASRLLEPEKPDLKGACEDYYARYEHDSVYGATITMVDCAALPILADVCRPLFSKYRSAIRELEGSEVQVYDRIIGSKDYLAFFDLKDLLREAGATEDELATVQEALDAVYVYEAHTPRFINVRLDRCCGLAMYLPAYSDYRKDIWHGTSFLDGFYKENVAWNEATLLVD